MLRSGHHGAIVQRLEWNTVQLPDPRIFWRNENALLFPQQFKCGKVFGVCNHGIRGETVNGEMNLLCLQRTQDIFSDIGNIGDFRIRMPGKEVQHHVEQVVGDGPRSDPDADMTAHGISQPLASLLQTPPAFSHRSRIFTKRSACSRQ